MNAAPIDARLDAHARVGQRTDRVEGAQRAEGDPGSRQRRGNDEHQPFQECHPGNVSGARPARAEHGGLDPPLLDQQAGHEHQRIGGQDHELDRQQQDARAAHQQRPIRILEHLREPGRDAEEGGVTQLRADPALQRQGVAAQPADVLEREVLEVGQRPPAHVQVAGRHAIDEVRAGDHQGPWTVNDAPSLTPLSSSSSPSQ